MGQRGDKGIAGFSLLEVVIAIAVLGLVTVPLCASLALSVRLNSHSRSLLTAQLAASGMVETLMERGIDPADDTFTPDGDAVYRMTEDALPEHVALVEVTAEEDGWYAVRVVGQADDRTVELTTAIREAGGGGP